MKQRYIIITTLALLVVTILGLILIPNHTHADNIPTGVGSISFPYQISDCQDLQNIQNTNTTNTYYVLTQNIDCSGSSSWNGGQGFLPITDFQGILDGEGYTVSGLYIDQESGSNITTNLGLFDSNEGDIENLNFTSFTEKASQSGSNIGGIVGTNNGLIKYVSISGSVTNYGCDNNEGSGSYSIGLLVGYNSSTISNSSATGDLTDGSGGCQTSTSGNSVGGLVGYGNASVSYSNVAIQANTRNGYVGGVSGYVTNLNNVYAAGSIFDNGENTAVGGIAGVIYGTATNSFSQVQIEGSGSCSVTCGGISGNSSSADLSTDYYDQRVSTLSECDGSGNTSCSLNAVNTLSDPNPAYFDDNEANPPLDNWDFSNFWSTTSSLPTLNAYVNTRPDEVTDLTASNQTSGSIDLSWEDPVNTGGSPLSDTIVNYEIAGSNNWTESDTGSTANNYTMYGLSPNTQYEFVVSVQNSNNDFSNVDSVNAATLIIGYHAVSTCQQLQDMNNALNDNYELTNNIDCSDTNTWNGGAGFVPIGNIDNNLVPFQGVLEGNGYSISGLYTNPSLLGGYYEFGGIIEDTSGAEIQDLKLESTQVSGALTVAGSLIGVDFGGTIIKNVQVQGAQISGPESYVGGIIGAILNPDSIQQSSFQGSISDSGSQGGNAFIGGLVGLIDLSTDTPGTDISNDYTNVNINDTNDASVFGGIVAYTVSVGPINISDSYASGNIDDQDPTSSYIGGILGSGNETTISNSFSVIKTTHVNGDGAQILGINGYDSDNSFVNDYYDALNTGASDCTNDAVTGCSAVNTLASPDSTYFDNNSVNPPLNSWDFTNTWVTTSGLPIFGVTPNQSSLVTNRTTYVVQLPASLIKTTAKSSTPTKTTNSPTAIVSTPADGHKKIAFLASTGVTPPTQSSGVTAVTNDIKHFIKNLPPSVIESFPYALFAFLLLASLLAILEIVWQTKRLKNTQVLLAKQKEIAEERDTFWHLAANYLRASNYSIGWWC